MSYHFAFFLGLWLCLMHENTDGTKSGLSWSMDISPITQINLLLNSQLAKVRPYLPPNLSNLTNSQLALTVYKLVK